jgi:hypothetical protein
MGRKLEWAAQPRPWLVFALALGLALRGYHYLSNPAVWHDEAALMINALGKDYAELLGPLFYSEAAPPLFLWVERVVGLSLGDAPFLMRLLPFLASCVGFVAAVALARRLLPPWGVFWFALLLGSSDRLLWHACEAKPYAVDMLVAVGLLAVVVCRRGDDEPGLVRLLLLYAGLSPFLVFLSFPSCFLLGAAALTVLPAVLRSRSRRVWGAYALFGLLLCGAFVLLVVGPVHAQKNERMLHCWVENFPPWDRPWKVPLMAVVRLTEVFRYATEPIGNGLTFFAVIGGVGLWRAGQRRLLAFLLFPFGLTALAWLGRQYPFGAARVDVFLAPAALLLVAAGLPPAFAWLRRAWPVAVALVLALVFPVAQAGYRVVVPWARMDSAAPAAFVLAHRQASEPVVGMLWEHAYYFRRLGPLYRALRINPTEPPTPPPTCRAGLAPGADVSSLWLIAPRDAGELANLLRELPPTGGWSVAERHDFTDMVVLHAVRAGQVAAAERPGR